VQLCFSGLPYNTPTLCNYYFCFTEIEEVFGGILEKEQDVSAGMAAIRTLLTVLEHDTCKCMLFCNMIQINATQHCRFVSGRYPLLCFS
jgi:hypothetical protein